MIAFPKLPYARDALEPHISEKTMDFHYGKHHKGYVDNLNKLIKGTEYEDMELDQIVKKSTGPIFNNAAQAWNHDFFWKCMMPDAPELESGSLAKAIKRDFGGQEEFKKKFTEAATKLFGSGWVWLVKDGDTLKIKQMKNANDPLSSGLKPILVCDVWEHAYYLDYQNERAKFVDGYFALINWGFAEENFSA